MDSVSAERTPLGLKSFRLSQLPTAPRVVITMFLALVGIGYLVALSHLYFTYNAVDGKPGVGPEDLKQSIYGKRETTLLEAKLVGGTMEKFCPDTTERDRIVAWARKGAPEAEFASIQPILQQRCVNCHNPDGAASFRPLTGFTEVAATAQMDRGESMPAWARTAHVHLQSLSVIFLLVGLAFSFCGLPQALKSVVVTLPFIALVTDFGARALAQHYPDAVYGVMASGAVMGLSLVFMVLATLYELWIWKPRPPMPQGQSTRVVLEGA